jgi:hypothetical protein
MWEHCEGRMKDSHTLIGLGGVYELRMVKESAKKSS